MGVYWQLWPEWRRRSNNLFPLVSDKRQPHSGYYEELSATVDFRCWPTPELAPAFAILTATDPKRTVDLSVRWEFCATSLRVAKRMMHHVKLMRAFVLVALLTGSTISATTYPLATPRVVASEDSLRLVRIEPGANRGVKPPYVGPFSALNARAVFFRYEKSSESYEIYQTVSLANASAPEDVILENDGKLVTFDSWGFSSGPAIAMYSASGNLIAAYALSELYSLDVIRRMRLRNEFDKVRWRQESFSMSATDGRSLIVVDVFENVFKFDMEDGSFEYSGTNPQEFSP